MHVLLHHSFTASREEMYHLWSFRVSEKRGRLAVRDNDSISTYSRRNKGAA